jgi:hypothetical protein
MKLLREGKPLLGELVVIVVGVLIALGVDAWYDGVVEARVEVAYLDQLLEDLAETESQMLAADASNAEGGASLAKLLAGFGSTVSPTSDSVRAWLGSARFVDNPVPILSTAEALVATGDLRLIRDGTLRVAVTRWLSRSRDFWLEPIYQLEELHRERYFEVTAFVDPMALPRAGRSFSDSLFGYAQPKETLYPIDADRFFHEKRVYVLLTDLYHLRVSMTSFRKSMREEAERLRRAIQTSTGRR